MKKDKNETTRVHLSLTSDAVKWIGLVFLAAIIAIAVALGEADLKLSQGDVQLEIQPAH